MDVSLISIDDFQGLYKKKREGFPLFPWETPLLFLEGEEVLFAKLGPWPC
jgi:hypothetical protein